MQKVYSIHGQQLGGDLARQFGDILDNEPVYRQIYLEKVSL